MASAFAKRHYSAVAGRLLSSKPSIDDSGHAYAKWDSIVHDLADMFAEDNANFKRQVFLMACGAHPSQQRMEFST